MNRASVFLTNENTGRRPRIWGKFMSSRSWFFAAGDQQQGPYSEEQFRDFIARGSVQKLGRCWITSRVAMLFDHSCARLATVAWYFTGARPNDAR